MIFQHTWQKVLSGEKTQTRRLAAPKPDGTSLAGCEMISFPMGRKSVTRGSRDDMRWNTKWQVGKTYAVQPGRGKKAIARIRITDIRREDVREISDQDIWAEGFKDYVDFWSTWCNMHDSKVDVENLVDGWQGSSEIGESLYTYLTDRPADRYQAWVIEFELVPESVLEPAP